MQGFERTDRGLLDTAVRQLVPAGSMFAFLAARRARASALGWARPRRGAGSRLAGGGLTR